MRIRPGGNRFGEPPRRSLRAAARAIALAAGLGAALGPAAVVSADDDNTQRGLTRPSGGKGGGSGQPSAPPAAQPAPAPAPQPAPRPAASAPAPAPAPPAVPAPQPTYAPRSAPDATRRAIVRPAATPPPVQAVPSGSVPRPASGAGSAGGPGPAYVPGRFNDFDMTRRGLSRPADDRRDDDHDRRWRGRSDRAPSYRDAYRRGYRDGYADGPVAVYDPFATAYPSTYAITTFPALRYDTAVFSYANTAPFDYSGVGPALGGYPSIYAWQGGPSRPEAFAEPARRVYIGGSSYYDRPAPYSSETYAAPADDAPRAPLSAGAYAADRYGPAYGGSIVSSRVYIDGPGAWYAQDAWGDSPWAYDVPSAGAYLPPARPGTPRAVVPVSPAPAPPRRTAEPGATEADREARRADDRLLSRINGAYDVRADFGAAVDAALDGEFSASVYSMRRAAGVNPAGLAGPDSSLARALANDPAWAQRVRRARQVYENPPERVVSEADARFMVAALSAPLGDRAYAQDAIARARGLGDGAASTELLRRAIDGEELRRSGPWIEGTPLRR